MISCSKIPRFFLHLSSSPPPDNSRSAVIYCPRKRTRGSEDQLHVAMLKALGFGSSHSASSQSLNALDEPYARVSLPSSPLMRTKIKTNKKGLFY